MYRIFAIFWFMLEISTTEIMSTIFYLIPKTFPNSNGILPKL